MILQKKNLMNDRNIIFRKSYQFKWHKSKTCTSKNEYNFNPYPVLIHHE